MPGDNAGNTFESAREIRVGSGLQTFSDRVDSTDLNDYYRFTVASQSSLNLVLNGLNGDASVQLLNSSGALVDASSNSGSAAEAINTVLAPGTYYVRVVPGNPTGADYTLNFNLQAGAGNVSLFWRDLNSGADGIWRMGGANNTSIAAIDGLPNLASTWQARAIADFNQDGIADILWRDSATGTDGIWLMGGANHAAISAVITLPSASTNWQIGGVADFNGDGTLDIVWRDTATGDNGVWLMGGANNATILSIASLTAASTNWQIAAVADFNRDGRPDLIWRDAATGVNGVWLMGGANNATITSVLSLTSVASNWQIAGVADFNQDGNADLVWRDTATGYNGVWLMGGANNATISAIAALPTAPPNWQPVALTEYSRPPQLDLAGNDFATAFNIGNLAGKAVFRDEIGGADPNDYYRITVNTQSSVNLSLSGLSADADLQLYDNIGILLQTSARSGTVSEAINTTLSAGNYYVRVYAGNPSTRYTLDLATAPALLSTVTLAATDAIAAETTNGQTANPGQFTITRTGSTNTALTVNYTISGTATNGSDYNQLGNSIVIPIGQSSITVPINVIDDALVEGTETVVFNLAANNAYTLGSTTSGTVNITDNDTPPDPIVRTKPTTGTNDIDALLSGPHTFWDGSANGGVITYSFYQAASGAYYGTEKVSEVSNAVKTAVREILASLESFVNVHFVEVADTASRYGVLRYMFSNGTDYAYAYYPATQPIGGDVHLSAVEGGNGEFSKGKGSYGYETLIHETFHALGLKHPGNYDAGGGGTEAPYLSPSTDNDTNTIMSYNNSGFGTGAAPITPMAYDVRALQYLYGAASNNAAATTYSFSSVYGYTVNGQFFGSDQQIKQTLWDSGGIDTLDFSGLAAGIAYRFDLNQGGLLTTQQAYNSGTYIDEATGGTYKTTQLGTAIAFNAVIENIINSRGNDTVIANSANNVFKGYGNGTAIGTDTIEGSNALDVLDLTTYRLADLTTTVSGNDLTIRLGNNGSVLAKNYFGAGGSMKVLVGGNYYTYNASAGWQTSTAPAAVPASPTFDFPTNVPSQPVTIEDLRPVAMI